jgi:pSer/pThr/pTyr-binding forkhead associated (FHA) protein
VVELPRCELVVLRGEERGKKRIVSGAVFHIGRAPENHLVLNDDTVSRQHCLITHDPKGYLLRDLGSTSGTLLDGAEVREAYLKPGAIITLGKIELKVRPYQERLELLLEEVPRLLEALRAQLPSEPPRHAPGERAPGAASPDLPPFVATQSYRETRAEWETAFEVRYVAWLLERHEGNISAAARAADMDRKYLHKLAKKHRLHPSTKPGP